MDTAVDTDPVDTDPVDTDPVDTDPVDTDVVDTDTGDTDTGDTDTGDTGCVASWWTDGDGDLFGDATAAPVIACVAPDGSVANALDCRDDLTLVNPDAIEVPYDGLDNDCDAATLDDDLDGDGFIQANDCDDGDAAVKPGAVEVAYDGKDNDCVGGDLVDVDGDGFASTAASGGTDCDDALVAVHPGLPEVCDGLDNDCLGIVDDGDAVGTGITCAATSCVALRDGGRASGAYYVNLDTPRAVFCDNTTEGGGWTVINPADIGTFGADLDTFRAASGQVLVYLADAVVPERTYTLVEQLDAYSAYSLELSQNSDGIGGGGVNLRLTMIPTSVAAVVGATQGFKSNGTELTFVNCDGNPNSYIELFAPGLGYNATVPYVFTETWLGTRAPTTAPIPSAYFSDAAIHQGGCGAHNSSSYWATTYGVSGAAFGLR